jgi:hypothetical protein
VIVYRRRQHQIDLFAWPASSPAPAPAAARTVDGYHVRAWTQDGFRLIAVSNLAEDELELFVRRWREADGVGRG